jgi:hypothetical protein
MEEVAGLKVEDPGTNPFVRMFVFEETPNLPWARGHNTKESQEKLLAYTLESLGGIVSASVEDKVIQIFLRDASKDAWPVVRSKVLNTLQSYVRHPV